MMSRQGSVTKMAEMYTLNFNVRGGDHTIYNKGSGKPTWWGDIKNKSKWYKAGVLYPYFYTTEKKSESESTIYIQYGHNSQGWATTKFFVYTIHIKNVSRETGNRLKFTVDVTLDYIASQITDFLIAGVKVTHEYRVNGQNFYKQSGTTADAYEKKPNVKKTLTFTVEPEETSNATMLETKTTYPDGEFENGSIFLGYEIKNNLPKAYKPMSIRKSGQQKTLNTEKGYIKIRVGKQWTDRAEEKMDTRLKPNNGRNRIRKNSQWLQLPEYP